MANRVLIKKMMTQMICQTYQNGDLVLAAGEISTHVYFIAAGNVSVTVPGARFKIAKLVKGSFFGDSSILFYSPATQSYYADNEGSDKQNIMDL